MRLPVCLDLVLSHLVKEGLEMGENEFIRNVPFSSQFPSGVRLHQTDWH